jgi:two-component system response regulator NreC
MRVALVDTCEVFRVGLWTLIAGHRSEAEKVLDCARAEAETIASVRPTVVFADLDVGPSNGLHLARRLKTLAPDVAVVAMAEQAPPATVRLALEAGVAGFLLRSDSAAELMAAFDRIAAGELVIPNRRHTLTPVGPKRGSGHPLRALSPREREVFDLAIWGCGNKEIARRLAISVKTVETHRARINGKLGSRTAVDMVRLASLWGLLERESDASLHGRTDNGVHAQIGLRVERSEASDGVR